MLATRPCPVQRLDNDIDSIGFCDDLEESSIVVSCMLVNMTIPLLIAFAGERVIFRLRHRLFQSVTNQEIAFFDKRGTGELVNRLSGDTSLVGHAITYNVSDGLRALVQASAGVSMMVLKAF